MFIEDELDLCDALDLPAKSLMYQSGYLTIKGLSKTEVDEVGNHKLVLGAPNHEGGARRDPRGVVQRVSEGSGG